MVFFDTPMARALWSRLSLMTSLVALSAIAAVGSSTPLMVASSRAQSPVVQPAEQAQAQALTIYQPLQRIPWEGQYTTAQGLKYFAVEPWSGAPVSEGALSEARAMGDRRKEAALLIDQGLEAFLGEQFERGVQAYKESLAIARELGDRSLQRLALGNLSLAYAQKGIYSAEGIESLQQFHQLLREEGTDPSLEGMALGNLGKGYFGADLYALAIETHQQRRSLAQKTGDRRGEAQALGDLGLVYQALGESEKARDLYQQQLAIAQSLQDEALQSLALGNLGIAYHAAGNYAQAVQFQQQRLTLAQKAENRQWEAEALANLAGAHYKMGEIDRAIALYDQAWETAWQFLRDPDILYGLRGNQGLAYFQKGDYATAEKYYQEYYTYVRSRNNRRGQGVAKNNMAVLQIQRGDLTGAARTLREGVAEWEDLRSRLGDNDAYKISIFETQRALYQNLQFVLMQLRQSDASLEVAERARARAFAELLARRVSPTDERSIEMGAVPNLSQIQQLAQSQQATFIVYSVISQTFRRPQALEARESQLLIWVVPPQGAIAVETVDLATALDGQTLADWVGRSRQSIGASDRGLGVASRAGGTRAAGSDLDQLYQWLIAPVAQYLPQNPDDRVVFVPQDALFWVPFAALRAADGTYLIEKHTLSVSPSLQVLQLTERLRAQNRAATSASLVVGNPTMPKVTVAAGEPPVPLPNLPGSESEAKAIADLLGTQPLLGAQATKGAVLQQMRSASLIHLATHGLMDDFRGLGVPGAIALAPSGADDGLLTASDLLTLQLQARLIVLSACNTGRGKLTGDGVVGLSRSLIAAGTPSLLVSLWAVPDAPTADLMVTFYQQLQQDPDKAKALRQAMLATKAKYPEPSAWAAFTLIGESR
ncbi:Tetratricopeptide TPR_1 repeat-containing protein [Geitlerinema sp. PCC 7407]|nr:Tetratricopeptide TPR_1 repeat-containing protein [Geitlerinema sp. PCC 7407]